MRTILHRLLIICKNKRDIMEQWNEKQKTISRYFGRLLHLFIGKIFKGTFNGLLFCSGVSILQELLYKICRIILSFVTYCAIYGHITNSPTCVH